MILTLFYITLIVVYIVDLSGFTDTLTDRMAKWLKVAPERLDLRPITCSLCLSLWVQVGYLVITGATLPYYVIACILSYLTPVFGDLLMGIKELLVRWVGKIK